jgi:hypothetical membrane protein
MTTTNGTTGTSGTLRPNHPSPRATYVDRRSLSRAEREAARALACSDQRARVTRALAGYGIIAGPFYVAVSLAQATTRAGFDLRRHAWSQLAIGDWGWVQAANLVLTGAMSLVLAVALRRTLAGGRGGRAVPVLVGVFGTGVLLAGLVTADPAAGFPVGVPTPAAPTLHGTLHLATSGLGFLALAAAMVVMSVRYARERRPGHAVVSGIAAAALLGGFAAISSGSAAGVPAFVVGIVAAFAWLSLLALDTYRRVTYSYADADADAADAGPQAA